MAHPQPSSTPFTPQIPLSHLCAAVAFERMSFTGVVALFVLYLNERYGLAPARAAMGLGGFVAATYLTPLVGGWLADRGLGLLRACILGTMLIALGGAGLMLDRLGALLPALALIAVGQGLFKPNAQALVSRLYGHDDPRRPAAFQTYYVAINVGFMIGPVLAEALRRQAGWGFSFILVVLGATLAMMAMGLPAAGAGCPASSELAPPTPQLPLRYPIRSIAGLCAIAALFCAASGQVAGTLLFWVRDCVDRRLFGHELPPAYFAALPALLVVGLAPLVARFTRSWGLLHTPRAKLMLGMLAVAAAFGLLVIPASHAPPQGAAMSWVVVCLALLCVGEILVMAMGMDAISRAVPAARSGLVYGLWCAAAAVGSVGAGLLGSLWGKVATAEFFALLAAGAGMVALGLGVRGALRHPSG